MNPRLFLAAFVLLMYGCTGPTANERTKAVEAPSRDDIATFISLDKRQLLQRLFDDPAFDSSGMAVWKGSYEDLISMSIPLSYDGKFHTSIDTILYFTDGGNNNCAVVVFGTYNLQYSYDSTMIEPTGCHFCGAAIGAALFYQTDGQKWELYDFKKEIVQLGYFGRYKTGRDDEGKIRLMNIGDNWTVLSITQGPGGNGGGVETSEILFSIEKYRVGALHSETLDVIFVNGNSFSDSFLNSNAPPSIQPIKGSGKYYDLLVRTIENDTVRTRTYRYSEECEKFIEWHP